MLRIPGVELYRRLLTCGIGNEKRTRVSEHFWNDAESPSHSARVFSVYQRGILFSPHACFYQRVILARQSVFNRGM